MNTEQLEQFEAWWSGLSKVARAKIILLQQQMAEGKVVHDQKDSCLIFSGEDDMHELEEQAQRLAAYVETSERMEREGA